MPHRIPGTRLGADQRRDLPRVAAAGAWLFGPAAWWTIRRSRRGDARTAERSWARMAARLLGLRLEIDGLDHIDPAERYVVAPLHEGFADAIALLHLPLDLRFIARDELADWRVLGSALRSGGHPVVRPEQPVSAYRTMLSRSPEILAVDSLVVFPQGALLGVEAAFTPGAFHLARRSDRPLLPVVIAGTHRVWEHPFTPVVRFGQTVRLEILPPVAPDVAVDRMPDIEREVKRRALGGSPGPRRYLPERDGWWDGYRFEIDPAFTDLAARVEAHRAG